MCFPDLFDLFLDLFLILSPGAVRVSLFYGLSSLLIERHKAVRVNSFRLLGRKVNHLIIVNCFWTYLKQLLRSPLLHRLFRLFISRDICAQIEVGLPQLLSILLPFHFGSGNSPHGLLTEIFGVQAFVNGYCRSIRKLLLSSCVHS